MTWRAKPSPRQLARARETATRIQEEHQAIKEMSKMPPTKNKTRSGLMDVPPDVKALREAADEAVEELRDALDVVTAAAQRNAKLDRAHTEGLHKRFPAAGDPR